MQSHQRPAAMLGIAALSGFSVVVVACGGGVGSVGGVGGEPIPFEQLGQKIADKLCPAIASCCSQNGFSEDHKTCGNMATALQLDFTKDKNKYGLTYDPQAAGNCVAQVVAAYGTCNPREATDPSSRTACDSFLRGRKAAGERCASRRECAPGSDCWAVSASSSGSDERICVRTQPAAAGAPCLTYIFEDQKPDPSKTYALCGLGSDDNFYCDGDTRTCKPRGGAGTECVKPASAGGVSNGTICDQNTYCNYDTKKCEPRVAAGGECKVGSECADKTHCDTTTRKCVALAGPGEPCSNDGNGNRCLYGCDQQSGKCRSNVVGRDMCSGNDID